MRQTPRTGFHYLDSVLDRPGGVIAMAHRGGATHPGLEGLENTLAAFEHAVALGYGYLETDVHATRDGALVSFHDERMDRVTDSAGLISESSAAQVARARIGGAHEIPTMAALLEHFPDTNFNIDIKSEGATRPLVDLLARTKSEQRVCVGSFSAARIREFRSLTGGRVATAASQPEVAAFLAPTPPPLLRRLARGPMRVLQIPWRFEDGRFTVASPALVRRAHAAGVHVHVWTGDAPSRWASIDDPESFEELLDLGVDGIIADRTDVLKDVLSTRGIWEDHA